MIIAPLWRRLAAILYDSVVLTGLWIIVSFLVTAAFGIEQARSVQGDVVVFNPFYRYAMMAALSGSGLLFFGWFWRNSGQTVGMQAWKIKVQNVDGSAISWRQAVLRYVTAPFGLLLCGVGYWWMLMDADRRTWPDITSDSVVVRIENFPQAQSGSRTE
jgi:uncharacterized RDD family membrane protein YckC